jgi:hypothetical protein
MARREHTIDELLLMHETAVQKAARLEQKAKDKPLLWAADEISGAASAPKDWNGCRRIKVPILKV